MVLAEKSSFRDTSARVIVEGDNIYRTISPSYIRNYALLMKSGLYDCLTLSSLMIEHKPVDARTIKPEVVPFISYPYEWSFNTLKQAAITTLQIAIIALEYDMVLKDASAYNIQYHNGSWKLIDTTSFEAYTEGTPWLAYGQFIRHFYLPLVLASYYGGKVLKWLQNNIDGLSPHEYIDLLPTRSYLSFPILLHLHLSKIVKSKRTSIKMPKKSVVNVLHNLLHATNSIHYKHKSDWQEYKPDYEYLTNKKQEVLRLLDKIDCKFTCDIGTNDGSLVHNGVVIDKDHDCINSVSKASTLPLVIDICNPTPAIGWAGEERKSFIDRANFDVVTALAILHHVCIGNNVPLDRVAELMSRLTKQHLIIEFVPEYDHNSIELSTGRVFPPYSKTIFEDSFFKHFNFKEATPLSVTRTLYWLVKK